MQSQTPAVPTPTIRDVLASSFWRSKWWVVISSVVFLGGTIWFMWFAFMSVPDTFGVPWSLASSAILLLILGAIIRFVWRSAFRHVLWQRYSASEGGYHSADEAPTSAAFVFQRGVNRLISDQITNPSSLPFTTIGNYSYYYYIQYKGEQIPFFPRKISFFTLTLPRNLPHIILDSKRNNLLSRYSEYGIEIEGLQRLELEGSFINSFSLYVPEGYERDALYIFSPDVMELMVNYAAEYDIEIIDNILYLFAPGHLDITDDTKLNSLATIGTALLGKLDKNITRYADPTINNRALDVIAPAGKRLTKQAIPFVLILFVIYLILVIYNQL